MSKRSLTPEERKLWRGVIKDVLPFKDSSSEEPKITDAPAVMVAISKALPAPKQTSPLVNSLDSESERRLQKGHIAPQTRLDLHGMTEIEAHTALLRIIEHAIGANYRLILVITGKGPREGGVLKRNLPRWLEALPPRLRHALMGYREALPRHGGSGAYYLLLRRNDRLNQ